MFGHDYFRKQSARRVGSPDGIEDFSLARSKYISPERVCFGATVGDPTPSQPIYLGTRENILITGVFDSGHSNTLAVILRQLSQLDDCAIVGVDLKAGLELCIWMPRLSFLATKYQEIDFLFDRLLEEQIRRVGPYCWNPSPDSPLIVVVIDELADLKNAPDDLELMSKLKRLVELSERQGIVFICKTKETSCIDSDYFRSCFSQSLTHRQKSLSDTLLATGVLSLKHARKVPAHQLSSAEPGKMYALTSESDEFELCQSFYDDEEACRAIAGDNSFRKVALPWLHMPISLYRGSVMQEFAHLMATK